jgi:hypothetical protein
MEKRLGKIAEDAVDIIILSRPLSHRTVARISQEGFAQRCKNPATEGGVDTSTKLFMERLDGRAQK